MTSLPAGRELDALVAEKVMGWQSIACLHGGNIPTGEPDDDWNRDARSDPRHGATGIPAVHREQVPDYSVDMAAAWLVVEKLLTMDIGIDVSRMPNSTAWHSALYLKDEDGDYMASADTMFEASSAPHAICLAALKAVTLPA